MKVETITFEQLVNIGNYENIKYTVTISLGNNETSSDAFNKAKELINYQIAVGRRERITAKGTARTARETVKPSKFPTQF